MTEKKDSVDNLIIQMSFVKFVLTYFGALAAIATVLSAIFTSNLSNFWKYGLLFTIVFIGYVLFLEMRINGMKKVIEQLKEENLEIRNNTRRY